MKVLSVSEAPHTNTPKDRRTERGMPPQILQNTVLKDMSLNHVIDPI